MTFPSSLSNVSTLGMSNIDWGHVGLPRIPHPNASVNLLTRGYLALHSAKLEIRCDVSVPPTEREVTIQSPNRERYPLNSCFGEKIINLNARAVAPRHSVIVERSIWWTRFC